MTNIAMENCHFFMGKLTSSIAIISSYFDITRGYTYLSCAPHQQENVLFPFSMLDESSGVDHSSSRKSLTFHLI